MKTIIGVNEDKLHELLGINCALGSFDTAYIEDGVLHLTITGSDDPSLQGLRDNNVFSKEMIEALINAPGFISMKLGGSMVMKSLEVRTWHPTNILEFLYKVDSGKE